MTGLRRLLSRHRRLVVAIAALLGSGVLAASAQAVKTPTTATPTCPAGATVGVRMTCTVTVEGTASSGDLTGTVTWTSSAGATFTPASRTCTLSGSDSDGGLVAATCTIRYRPMVGGTDQVTATYGGSGTAASGHMASGPGLAIVSVHTRPTTTSVACAPTSVTIGDASRCVATVADTGPGNVSTPSGSVRLSSANGAALEGPCTLAPSTAGSATCAFVDRPRLEGPETATVTFDGDAHEAGSSGQTTFAAVRRAVTIAVGCAPAAVHVGQPTTCTGTVADAAGGAAPGGDVHFDSSAMPPQHQFCTLVAGSCSITYTPSVAGDAANRIAATYTPDAIHAGGASAATTVAVTGRATTLALSCTPTALLVAATSVCTATVTDTEPGAAPDAAPDGDVALSGGGLAWPSCALDPGSGPVASCTVTVQPTAAGPDAITATYPGSASFAAAVPASVALSVSGPAGPLRGAAAGGAQNVLLTCTHLAVRVVDAEPNGAHVRLTGIVAAPHAGKTVSVAAGGRTLGHAQAASDGSFGLSVAKSRHGYVATVAGHRSPALATSSTLTVGAPRRSRSGVKLRGRLRGGAHRTISLTRLTGCASHAAAIRRRTSATGAYAATLPLPAAAVGSAVYRVTGSRRHGRSLTRLVVVRR